MTNRWLTIAAKLRDEIERGVVGNGGELDTEAELCARFEASRITVRRALQELKAEGLVQSRQGSGWTARHVNRQQRRVRVAAGNCEHGTLPLTRMEVRWRTLRPTATLMDVGRRLGVTEFVRADWCRLSYVMRARGIPFDLVDVWFAPGTTDAISRDELAALPTARTLQQHGIAFAPAIQTVRSDLATDRDAARLGLTPGDAMLVVERVLPDRAGSTVFVSIHRHPGRLVTIGLDLPTTDRHHEASLAVTLT